MTARSLGWILPAILAASEWPQFRGPNASGVSEETKLPLDFGPDRNVVWKTAVPPGHSSPSVGEDKIFLSAIENERFSLWPSTAPRDESCGGVKRPGRASRSCNRTTARPLQLRPPTAGMSTCSSRISVSSPTGRMATNCGAYPWVPSTTPSAMAPLRSWPETPCSCSAIRIPARSCWPSTRRAAGSCGARNGHTPSAATRRRSSTSPRAARCRRSWRALTGSPGTTSGQERKSGGCAVSPGRSNQRPFWPAMWSTS